MSAVESLRFGVRVRPGAARTRVGGRYGPDDLLVVAVTARAVDGAATEAVLLALAAALEVPRRAVRLVSGATARTKVIEVVGEPEALARKLAQLRDGGSR